MNKKKLLSKLVVASVMVGGINFLPVPNFDAKNFQSSIAYAEVKTITASDAAMSDVESLNEMAKKVAQERAIKAAQERAGVYVSSYSRMVKGRLTDDDITAVTNSVLEVMDVKYRKLLYQAADENGNRFGKVGEMYEATVTVKIDTDGISEYIKRTAQEKAKLIQQAKDSQATFEEINKNYEDLRKNLKNKTPQQIQAETKKIDDKISAQQKKRDKNKSSNKKTTTTKPKDKPKTNEKRNVSNKQMNFSNPVTIGEFGASERAMGIYIHGASNVNEQPRYVNDHGEIYSKGIARFGDGNDALYLHYDFHSSPYKVGGNDFKNAISYDDWYGAKILKVNASNGYTMYFLKKIYYIPVHQEREFYILIGRRPDGKWVKYFDTEDLCKQYMGNSKNVSIQKVTINGSTIIANYARCNHLSREFAGYFYEKEADEFGEFRFKWDEAAKWFSVEKIDNTTNATPQKTTQENNQSNHIGTETEVIQKIVGTYKGSYFASQGETGLTLIVYEEKGKLKAIFDFYNLPGRSNAKDGKYYMNVLYDKETNNYKFVGYEWISRPSNYLFADLKGKLNGNVLSGAVLAGWGNYTFNVKKVH